MRSSELRRGRAAFDAQSWCEAYSALTLADRDGGLDPSDLELLAMAAYLVGRDGDSAQLYGRGHREFAEQGDPSGAARCAFWLGFQLINRGEMAQANGWFARARTVLPENTECVEQGLIMLPSALQHLFGDDAAGALPIFREAATVGQRFGNPDLSALSRLGQGQSLIALGHIDDGIAVLDEVMVAVTTREVSAVVMGLVYCSVVSTCYDIFDLQRAQEWTEALSEWCASQPDLVPYRGQCLVHRAEIMQLHGEWAAAMKEAERARSVLLEAPDQPIVGRAFYVEGELHRLRGQFTEAEVAYRQANQWRTSPQPGLAQLRLLQGEVGTAEASIRRVLQEANDRRTRARILPAVVEIMLEAGDVAAARAAALELSEIAKDLGAPFLAALASFAQGSVHLAEGDAVTALAAAREAWATWCEFKAPHEAARARILIGIACRELGDSDTAAMEFDAARQELRGLGATPDLAGLEELSSTATPKQAAGLTGREVEVLALVATGKTNREISEDLVISEKTVARHLSNIFVKLGVSSRAAATAYAFKHDLA